ncbi:MAG: tetratricopeptide repeat protein [Nitrospiraceae bacterium]
MMTGHLQMAFRRPALLLLACLWCGLAWGVGLDGRGWFAVAQDQPQASGMRHPNPNPWDGAAAARWAAQATAAGGWTFLIRGDIQGAQQAFQATVELAPKEASYWVGLGLSWHRAMRESQALPALEQALLLDPHVGQAHKLLGDILERQGDVRTALAHFETALRQDPADIEVRERLPGLRRAVQFEGTLSRIFNQHFVVAYQGIQHRAMALQVAQQLDRTAEQVGRLFDYMPQDSFTVILYPREQFRSVTGSPRWVVGFFDGRLHLPVESLGDQPQAWQALLVHEYAHAVVHRLSAGRAPVWLQEGLALYSEDPSGSSLPPARAAAEAELRQAQSHLLSESPGAAAQAYADSERTVRALIDKHGWQKIRRLLLALADAASFETAFASVMGEPFRGSAGEPVSTDVPVKGRDAGGHAS